MRARLGRQVQNFLDSANLYLPDVDESDLYPSADDSTDAPPDDFLETDELLDNTEENDLFYEDEDRGEVPSVLPETIILPLPSNIISSKIKKSIHSLIFIERELRKGQANDALEGLRIGLANKSLLLLTDVNKSNSTKQSTRAWANVRNAQSQILVQAGNYRRAWQALNSLGNQEDLAIYQKLEDEELVVVKDITAAKRYGQGSERLAWFWRIGPSEDALTGKWMEECEINSLYVKFCFHQSSFCSLSC